MQDAMHQCIQDQRATCNCNHHCELERWRDGDD